MTLRFVVEQWMEEALLLGRLGCINGGDMTREGRALSCWGGDSHCTGSLPGRPQSLGSCPLPSAYDLDPLAVRGLLLTLSVLWGFSLPLPSAGLCVLGPEEECRTWKQGAWVRPGPVSLPYPLR